jgi:hypothetical protein
MAGPPPSLTPMTTERKKLTRTYLGVAQKFSALRIPEGGGTKFEPIDYESTRKFDADINNYYNFHINYTPHFNHRWNPFRPTSWLYYIDINDEVIEQKFPRDQDIRAIITAFRYSIERNRASIIALKRAVQAIGIVLLFLPYIIFQASPQLAHSVPAVATVVSLSLAITAVLAWFQHQRDSQLQTVLESNGRTLANEIQGRANDLNRHFLEFFARIDREETNEDMANPEWTHRSAWWMKLSMWYPRRIEAIEVFLQSEMQRTRIFMLRSAWVGYASAASIWLVIPAVVTFVVSQVTGSQTMYPALAFWGFGAFAATLLTWYSVRTSIDLDDVADALGKEPLGHDSRFADLNLHNKLAGQTRRDKERLRKFYLRGGFGETHKT